MSFSAVLFVISVALLTDLVESQDPTINVEISDHLSKVGDNVTVTCTLTWLSANTVTLHKVIVQHEGSLLTEQIAINDGLTRFYANLKRFSVIKATDGESQLFTLRITGVQLEDSGNYGCAVTTLDALYAVKSLEVYRKPTNISFIQYNQSIATVHNNHSIVNFRENERPNLKCQVPDVLPIPSVHIWMEREVISPKDITGDFVVGTQQNVMCNQNIAEKTSCPLHSSYTMEAINRDFNVSFNHDGKTMTCKATMRTLDKDEISTEIRLKVIYVPKILCAGVWNTTLNSTNLEIRCRIHANPPSDRANKSVTVKETGRLVLVTPGEDSQYYSLEDKVMASTDGKVTEMVFTVKTVTEEHFNYEYTFYAANAEGKTTKTIRIENTLTPIIDGAEGCHKGSHLLSLFLFVLFANIFGRL